MKGVFFPALLVAGLLLGGCAPRTPQARIAAHPEIFEGLPSRHRKLVSEGRIERGMSEGAVFLAWGRPDRTAEGARNGRDFTRWDYASYYPVHRHRIYGYYGPGWYGYRRYYGGFASVPAVEYVPYLHASVWFRSRRVDSWERGGPLW